MSWTMKQNASFVYFVSYFVRLLAVCYIMHWHVSVNVNIAWVLNIWNQICLFLLESSSVDNEPTAQDYLLDRPISVISANGECT